MMKFLFAGLFFVGSIFLSFVYRHDFEFVVIGIATILGFVTGKVFELQKDLKSIREALAKDWEQRSAEKSSNQVKSTSVAPSKEVVTHQQEEEPIQDIPLQAEQIIAEYSETKTEKTTVNKQQDESIEEPSFVKDKIAEDSLTHKISTYIKDYFMGGNLFVRIGIIILFFGVSFLLKYVSDRGMFPIEYRLIGVVIGAMALLGLGWRLRHKNETYALLLQGAGIGVLYLDIYAAFSLYQLIPPLAAFALLFVVSIFSAALAVLQDSKSLAVLGFSGGFLAPVLASSGSNNHVGLFSYYAVLNLAIVGVAWFKAWRGLNLLGFAFTFIIGTAWGVLSYNSSKFASTEPFLILFFLFYVLIAVLFALRQPPKLRGYVDGTLLFGVPLAASGLQYVLVKDFEYGVSLSSFAMGAFYLVLSWFIWKRKGDGLKLLAEAFLALGVIFASMAIPFALAPTQTAAAWALEGAGLLWLGSRQNRLSVRVFGLILQVGAGLIFIGRHNPVVETIAEIKPFINAEFISSMMMTIAAIVSARLLIKTFEGRKDWEKGVSPILLVWGLLWFFGGFVYQIVTHYAYYWLPSNMLLLSAVSSFGFTLVAMRFKPDWKHAWIAASGLFALILFMALAQFANHAYQTPYHPLQYNGWLAWPVVFIVYYFLLKKLEQHQVLQRFQPLIHSLLLLLLVAVITLEGDWYLRKQLANSSDWLGIWYAIPTILALWMTIKAKIWPFSIHKQTYRQQTGLVLAAYLSLWSFIALIAQGKSDPLPWLPLLNPLDIVLFIVFISLFKWWKTIADDFTLVKNQSEQNRVFNQRVIAISIAGLVFLWLNFTLFRVAHHWFDISYQTNALYNSSLVQTSVSILWALSGVILTVYASRKQVRFLWLTGAVLLGLVVLKLFVIDLSTLSSLARIISFIVVGLLLTSIGYFAPLPDQINNDNSHEQDKDHEQEENQNV